MDAISPKYQMTLVRRISEAIWAEYSSYAEALYYIKKWHEHNDDWNNPWENFSIVFKDQNQQKIDLQATLHNIDGDTLLKMAIDLGLETPNFIPAIPIFRNEIKSDYSTACIAFEKAFRCVENDPATAVGLVNSALESVIKEILKDGRIFVQWEDTDTLYSLVKRILTEFKLTIKDLPTEIKTITSSLLAASQAVERLRSGKTLFHGKTKDDYVLSDPMYGYLVINSVASIGLFLISFYNKKYPSQTETSSGQSYDPDDLPF